MKIGKGVEWSAHACAILAVLPKDHALSKEALADFLGLPPTYLAKQLQALSRAGIVAAQRGVAGGYRLAKAANDISLWDITAAIEGSAPSFRCTEIRRNGPCGASPKECPGPCHINASFQQAEQIYRDSLAAIPLSQLVAGGAQDATDERKLRIKLWIQENAATKA